jgi:putative ABC transport system permease protein
LGVVAAVVLTYRRLFSPDHRFMASKLIERQRKNRRN